MNMDASNAPGETGHTKAKTSGPILNQLWNNLMFNGKIYESHSELSFNGTVESLVQIQ